MKAIRYFAISLAIFGSMPLFAQVWVPTGTETRRPSALQFDAGVNSYRGDYYGYISPNITYNHGNNFGYSFSLPVNTLLVDRDPLAEGAKTGKIRDIDYNSRNDYSRVLNYVSYGTYNQQVPGKVTYSFYTGKMIDGYIGHGTIVNKYQSSSRFDSYNPGVMADLNTDYGGVQYFSNSVATFDVNAARVYIKPFAIYNKIRSLFSSSNEGITYLMNIRGNVLDDSGRLSVEEEAGFDKTKPGSKQKEIRPINKDSRMEIAENDPWYNRLTLGFTNAWDRSAPMQISYNSNGSPVTEKNLDNPKTSETSKVSIEGFDAEYRLLNLPYLELTPYMDVNKIKGLSNSQGTHYGAALRLGTKDLNIIIKPEIRHMTANYAPMYFDSFYEIERFQSFPVGAPMRTKFDTLKTQPEGNIKGYYHTVYINFFHLGFEFAMEDYGGKNNKRIFAASYIPLGSSFLLSFYYTKKGYESGGQAFQIDENAQGAAEISKSFGPVVIRIQNYRRYFLNSPEKTFQSTDELRFLISGGISF
ncbi:membrane protein [Leptospira kobayashii]|uniref:Membrane protein n=1 Tax=Leptospira kobayashii TaxID=1917830 RepID=A0ABN6KIL9_9LEPT|nr:hypothetical protein [Leptospira kobayashii]BDA78996.1 membrane protein [Leptospira kobayashii]